VIVSPRVTNHTHREGTASVISRGVLSKVDEIRPGLRQSTQLCGRASYGRDTARGSDSWERDRRRKMVHGKQGDQMYGE